MPEGPECRIMIDGLQQIVGKKIVDIKPIGTGKFAYGQHKTLTHLNFQTGAGKSLLIKEINCKGKFIWWILNNGTEDSYYSNGLGMTGGWSFTKTKHSQIYLKMEDNKELYFNDVRHFGSFTLLGKKSHFDKKISKLGTDPLQNFPFKIKFYHSENICSVLMNQAIFAGVGNYIKNESLYKAEISPYREVGSLSEAEMNKLIESVITIMKESYAMGGCSVKDYFHIDGKTGSYQNELKVYGRKKDPLGNIVNRAMTPDGRSTYWVPEIQK